MGWFSSACSAVSSAFSSVCSAVSSACSSVLSGITNVVNNSSGSLITALALSLPISGALLKAVTAIDVICKVLGMLEPKETTEDIGDRAIQAQEAGIRPENYGTYKEYLSAIKNFEIDPKKSDEINQLDKLVAGVGVHYWGFEEKFGLGTGDLISKTIESPDYFTGERLEAYLDAVENISDVVEFFDGKLSPADQDMIEDKLIEVEKGLHPEKSTADILKELSDHTQLRGE